MAKSMHKERMQNDLIMTQDLQRQTKELEKKEQEFLKNLQNTYTKEKQVQQALGSLKLSLEGKMTNYRSQMAMGKTTSALANGMQL